MAAGARLVPFPAGDAVLMPGANWCHLVPLQLSALFFSTSVTVLVSPDSWCSTTAAGWRHRSSRFTPRPGRFRRWPSMPTAVCLRDAGKGCWSGRTVRLGDRQASACAWSNKPDFGCCSWLDPVHHQRGGSHGHRRRLMADRTSTTQQASCISESWTADCSIEDQ